ncbi:MAG: hypothetical protein A2X84_00300 [Desulfuromonadaceae bacterium GWC2_58_13]|nr:MAG: hypothetical protein A2X84_00300 [Desulfuromonadaceae bacterium GWC2_58_13]
MKTSVYRMHQALRTQMTMCRGKKTACIGTSLLLILTLLSLDPAAVSAGTIFKWRDQTGQLNFTDSELNIPPEYRDKASKKTVTEMPRANFVPAPTATKSNIPTQSTAAQKDGATIDIPFTAREGTADRVIIDIVFNGRVTAPIMVDTGSPGLVISAELASQLGLFREDSSNLLVTIGGIGGSEVAIRTIVDKVQIGSITEEYVPAHIVEEMADAYQGLVGMDILADYTVTIDSANKRLTARKNPASDQLPAGHGQDWWQRSFREFNYYKEFWENQLKTIDDGGGPYTRLPSSRTTKIKAFIEYQRMEADKLLRKLDRYASWKGVPRHWRR